MYLSVLGLVVGLIAHVSFVLAWPVALRKVPWGSFVAIYGVGVIFMLGVATYAITTVSRDFLRSDFLKEDISGLLLRGCPVWMRRMFFLIFLYAGLTFLWRSVTVQGWPSDVREIFGLIVAGYCFSTAMLYSAIHVSSGKRESR